METRIDPVDTCLLHCRPIRADHHSMRTFAAAGLVFLGGFVIMVLEIIGARFLARDFGSSFYVWVSQIGVVLIALALGYYLGGALADRWQRLWLLITLLVPAGVLLCLIPNCAAWVIDKIVLRHPADLPVPLVWQKLDPVLGSATIFLLPCIVARDALAVYDSAGDAQPGAGGPFRRVYHCRQHSRQYCRGVRGWLRVD